MITAIILAAGESRRYGHANKLFLPYRDKTLIEHTVDVVSASRVTELVVVLGHEAERVRAVLGDRQIVIVENPSYRQGMVTTIQAGIRAAWAGIDGWMICLSDLPLLEPTD